MSKKSIRMVLVLCLSTWILQSCGLFSRQSGPNGPQIGDLIIGWNEMLMDMEEHTLKMDELAGRQYKLTLKLAGDWGLQVTPESALQVTPVEGESGQFILKVINAQKLFELTSGLIKRAYIEAKLTKIGGDKGKINLTGALDCLFDVSFHQINGEKVNFEQLSSGHIDEFIINNPDVLKLVAKKKDAVTFSRPYGGDEEITLSLKLTDKTTKEVYESAPIMIPNCSKGNSQEPNIKRLVRKADQCLMHLKGGPKVINDQENVIRAVEVFANNCPEPIECTMTAKYGLVQGPNVKKVFHKEFTFNVGALDHLVLDTTYNIPADTQQSFHSKIYSIPVLAKDAIPLESLSLLGVKENSQENEFIQCHWK